MRNHRNYSHRTVQPPALVLRLTFYQHQQQQRTWSMFIHVKSWPLIKFHVLSFSTSKLGLVAGRCVGVCGSRSIQERFVCLHSTIMMIGISISFRAFGFSIDIKSSIFLLYSEIPNTLSTVFIRAHQKNANISLLRLKVCLALKTDYLHMKGHRLQNESTIWVIDYILRPVKTFRIYIFIVSYDILRRYVRKLQGYDYEDETSRTRMIRYFFLFFHLKRKHFVDTTDNKAKVTRLNTQCQILSIIGIKIYREATRISFNKFFGDFCFLWYVCTLWHFQSILNRLDEKSSLSQITNMHTSKIFGWSIYAANIFHLRLFSKKGEHFCLNRINRIGRQMFTVKARFDPIQIWKPSFLIASIILQRRFYLLTAYVAQIDRMSPMKTNLSFKMKFRRWQRHQWQAMRMFH